MKTFILSAIAAAALFASGAPAQAYHYGSGYGYGHGGGHYGGSYAAPGPYVNVGSYDAYRGHAGYHGGRYGIRPARFRTYGSTPRYTTPRHSYGYHATRSYPLKSLGTTYVSPPYTLPERPMRTYSAPTYATSSSYGLPPYTYRSPSYYSGTSYRPAAVPSTYTTSYGGSYGTVNTVPYDQTYTGSYDYRCAC